MHSAGLETLLDVTVLGEMNPLLEMSQQANHSVYKSIQSFTVLMNPILLLLQ